MFKHEENGKYITYCISRVISIPYAILGNRGFIENRTSVCAAKPFDPGSNLCRRPGLGLEVVLQVQFNSFVDLAALLENSLVALINLSRVRKIGPKN